MKTEKLIRQARQWAEPYRVTRGSRFRLKLCDPADIGAFKSDDKPRAQEWLAEAQSALAALQDRLYAQDQWAVLLVFQAMDAAGKDGAIKHVMSGVNPQGCQVTAFKAPSAEELDHDYLWRCMQHLPERGRIGIFNRSYYEEVLVVRVHPEFLGKQKLPSSLITDGIWRQRHEDIRQFERYLSHNGVLILKFFLHVSKKEQKERFLERLETPEKHWKFSAADVREREHWPKYMAAYDDMIRHTASEFAPWYVVPADHKWFTRVIISSAILDALDGLELSYPKLNRVQLKELEVARAALEKS